MQDKPKQSTPYLITAPKRHSYNSFFNPLAEANNKPGLKKYTKEKSPGHCTVWLANCKSEVSEDPIFWFFLFNTIADKWQFIMELSVIGAEFQRLILGKIQPKSYAGTKIKNDTKHTKRFVKYLPHAKVLHDFLSDVDTLYVPDEEGGKLEYHYNGETNSASIDGLAAAVVASIYCGDHIDHKTNNYLINIGNNNLRFIRIDPETCFSSWPNDHDLVKLLQHPITELYDDLLVLEFITLLNPDEDEVHSDEIEAYLDSTQVREESYATLARILSLPVTKFIEVVEKNLSSEFAHNKLTFVYLLLNNHLAFIDTALKLPGFQIFYEKYHTTHWPIFFGEEITSPLKPLATLQHELLILLVEATAKLHSYLKDLLQKSQLASQKKNFDEAKSIYRALYMHYNFLLKSEEENKILPEIKRSYLINMLEADNTLFNELEAFLDANKEIPSEFFEGVINKLISLKGYNKALSLALSHNHLQAVIRVLLQAQPRLTEFSQTKIVTNLINFLQKHDATLINGWDLSTLRPSDCALVIKCLECCLSNTKLNPEVALSIVQVMDQSVRYLSFRDYLNIDEPPSGFECFQKNEEAALAVQQKLATQQTNKKRASTMNQVDPKRVCVEEEQQTSLKL